MREQVAEASPRRWGRTAGVLYLIIILGGFFAIGFVPALIVVPGDAAATMHNLQANILLYRLGLVIHIVVLLCNIPLMVIFLELFKVVNRQLALLVASFLLAGTAIESITVLNQFTPLLFLGGKHFVSVFSAEQLQALMYIPLDEQTIGYTIQQVFYAGYLLAGGYLVFRSTFLPRAVGILLALGGLCYLVYSFSTFLVPAFAAHLVPYIQLPSLLGEGSLMLWLLIGVNAERWQERANCATP